ncbi:ABC-F family ATP-binding cassette domain-containing protein [Conexibacter sp. CPCC 206217]|uniref:ABC-F family ATP-binding cassette domain-containing protein n=1 Tax=Conexibacter sp. CPCC 206217 TaxID=3064574 RepID=UPI00271B090E|nr:ABC-F family ATP-binding cassette domain-containing protein [Conexibacter sp. CPCC 206217]MDO8211213.1 ABC-F family ATP-binding cassette domain-containing protein [Conexibacter sp. CPCC 206217]
MAAPPRNLVNLKSVDKGYGSRSVLRDVTLGVNAGDRIGIVGINGGGKSTLLKLIGGMEDTDAGAVTRVSGLHLATIAQGDELDGAKTIRDELVGGRADHEWAADSRFRAVLDGLLGGVAMARFPQGLDTPIGPLSGGERRRIALAQLLLDSPDLLLLDEPTNHLDVEGVAWLARHLAGRRGSMVVITHDRWFLDAVCTQTWEVSDGTVHQYEGGYAAYVLARAERDRQASTREDKRQQLVRKELAWLRRGPPARTAKPKFRIEAANALIADEPPARDGVELLRFSSSRLGDKVLDAEELSVAYGDKVLLRRATWRLGPGDRVALVGVNGSGKTTLIKLLAGELSPSTGVVERGATVKLAHLSQDAVEIPGDVRVLQSLEQVRGRIALSDGQELTAGQLCDRFGFRGSKSRTFVRDLSGGERRRLQLMRLLMNEPNVLLLDEPTNDLDIDTLTALEDLLDGWPGTLVVVSHDRYFVERVTDDVYALAPDGSIRHLPGGIEQYLEQRAGADSGSAGAGRDGGSGSGGGSRGGGSGSGASGNGGGSRASGGELRAARKEVQRLERALERLDKREASLHEQMAEAATDHGRLRSLNSELADLSTQRETLESAWLEASATLES